MMKRFCRVQQSSGFTLLEIIIALSVISLIIPIVYLLYSSVVSVADNTQKRALLESNSRMVIDRMSEDLKHVHTGQEGFLIGGTVEYVGAEEPFLSFLSTTHLVLDPVEQQVDAAVVRYYLKKSSKTGSFILLRSDTPVVGIVEREQQGENLKHVMSRDLVSMKMIYLGQNGEQQEVWDSEIDYQDSPDDQHFPVAFRIELQFGSIGTKNDKRDFYEFLVPVPKSVIEFEAGS